MSDSVRPHRWQPTRLPRPWDSPGKNTGVGCHFLLQCRKVKSESEVSVVSDPLACCIQESWYGSMIHHFPPFWSWIIVHCMDGHPSTHPSMDTWVTSTFCEYFCYEHWCTGIRVHAFNPSGKIPRSEITGLCSISMFKFFEEVTYYSYHFLWQLTALLKSITTVSLSPIYQSIY